MRKVLDRLFTRFAGDGSLDVVFSDGVTSRYGQGRTALGGPDVAIRLADEWAELRLALDPELAIGELYMDGRLRVERGTIYDFLCLLLATDTSRHGEATLWIHALRLGRRLWARLVASNPVQRAARNVAHHYDLDQRLYSLFLDEDRQYSCAYFERWEQSLEEAQTAKKRHLAAKLLVRPGHSVLDIGSGWGGLAFYLARHCDARVTGVTLSEEQYAISRTRASDSALRGRADFLLRDYRTLEGRFDRIVSVGMFEHVGGAHYMEFFDRIGRLLDEDGIALVHSIGRTGPPAATNPWIEKYIFPGGHIPSLSEIAPAVERSGLVVTDLEILRLHYAETLRAWRARFLAHIAEARRIYDERFCRMWEFYLAGSETAFRFQDMAVFQIQLARRQDAVPVTRDYIAHEEARLRRREGRGRPAMRLAGE